MESKIKTKITVETTVGVPVEKAWKIWSTPEDIVKWNSASDEWHTPRAENDLREGGSFLSRMEAKDGSMGFDFGGIYDKITKHKQIDYTMGDGRRVWNTFESNGRSTKITVTFEAETENPEEMQRNGWQAILNNFKKYAESN